jgi:preprotein translocase subunit SecA
MNDQRKVIFEQRVEMMKDESVAETVADMRHDVVDDVVTKHMPEHAYAEQWDVAGLKGRAEARARPRPAGRRWAKEEGIADEEMLSRIEQRVDEHMAAKVAQWGPDVMRYVEKTILLQTLDHLWREHLVMLDHLRQVIGLRGYGQRDPLNEYKSEAFSCWRCSASPSAAPPSSISSKTIPPSSSTASRLPWASSPISASHPKSATATRASSPSLPPPPSATTCPSAWCAASCWRDWRTSSKAMRPRRRASPTP